MQQHSNAYIIGFAAAVCLVCSVIVLSCPWLSALLYGEQTAHPGPDSCSG
mgnify:CR=1 FL=1